MNLLAIAPIDHDLARTLARMLERRLAGRAGDAAAYADLAPPVSKGVEAWFELILRGDDAARVRLAAALARLAPADAEVLQVRRELDGTRPRLQKLAWATAIAGFAVAAGMLLFGGAPSREVPALEVAAPDATQVVQAPPSDAPNPVAAPSGAPSGVTAPGTVYGPASPPAATMTPPTNVYGPAAPAFTAPAVAPAALPAWSAPVAPATAVVPMPVVAPAPAAAPPSAAPAPAAPPAAPAPALGAPPAASAPALAAPPAAPAPAAGAPVPAVAP